MRNTAAASMTLEEARDAATAYVKRQLRRLSGLAVLGGGSFILASLATWNIADPSLNHASGNPVTNAMGPFGAILADILTQSFGIAAMMALVPLFSIGWTMARGKPGRTGRARGLAWLGFTLSAAGARAALPVTASWALPTGLGGVFGELVLKPWALFAGQYPSGAAHSARSAWRSSGWSASAALKISLTPTMRAGPSPPCLALSPIIASACRRACAG